MGRLLLAEAGTGGAPAASIASASAAATPSSESVLPVRLCEKEVPSGRSCPSTKLAAASAAEPLIPWCCGREVPKGICCCCQPVSLGSEMQVAPRFAENGWKRAWPVGVLDVPNREVVDGRVAVGTAAAWASTSSAAKSDAGSSPPG